MNEIQIFSNPSFGSVRTVDIDGVPWFVGKDVASALGYANSRKAIQDHVDDEDKNTVTIRDGIGNPNTNIINESGLYSLILTSKLPAAKAFKRWITSEVLPAIRRTGAYSVEAAQETPYSENEPHRVLTIDDYIKAAQIIAGCKNERLPYVTKMLERAGIPFLDGVKIEGEGGGSDKELGIRAAKLINLAVSKYGWTETAISRLIGIDDNVQIHRYRSGITAPREMRARLIISALEKAIPELAEYI